MRFFELFVVFFNFLNVRRWIGVLGVAMRDGIFYGVELIVRYLYFSVCLGFLVIIFFGCIYVCVIGNGLWLYYFYRFLVLGFGFIRCCWLYNRYFFFLEFMFMEVFLKLMFLWRFRIYFLEICFIFIFLYVF